LCTSTELVDVHRGPYAKKIVALDTDLAACYCTNSGRASPLDSRLCRGYVLPNPGESLDLQVGELLYRRLGSRGSAGQVLMIMSDNREVVGQFFLPPYLRVLGWIATGIMFVAAICAKRAASGLLHFDYPLFCIIFSNFGVPTYNDLSCRGLDRFDVMHKFLLFFEIFTNFSNREFGVSLLAHDSSHCWEVCRPATKAQIQ
jgi:hypothetical protein